MKQEQSANELTTQALANIKPFIALVSVVRYTSEALVMHYNS